jgi:hypothetical protein
MGARTMNKLGSNHPSSEALAEFAEGRSLNATEIEAHLDTCESCAHEVIAGREAIALESLGSAEFRMTQDFESRARRQLLAVIGSKSPPQNPASHLGALGAIGLLGGLGGLGSFTAAPDLVLAEGDHPHENPQHSEEMIPEREISGPDAPSHASEDEVSRMLEHIHDVLGDAASNQHSASTDHATFADDFSAQTDSTTVPDGDIPPVEHDDTLDHGSDDHDHDHGDDHHGHDDFHG